MTDSDTKCTVAMIGAGNMARALIGGLMRRGHPPNRLVAADPDKDTRSSIEQEFGIAVHATNEQAVAGADLVVLAVKPQVVDQVAASIAAVVDEKCVVISVAAGIPVSRLRLSLGANRVIVRVMPNTPALHGAGATGIFAAPGCSDAQLRAAAHLFESVGKVFPIEDESLMDVVTAVSGSGPAYFFALAEALAEAGCNAGLDAATAHGLATQTAAGAGAMLGADGASAAELRRRVTSPGGTTAAALDSLNQNGFAPVIESAVSAAVQRGRELGAESGLRKDERGDS